MMKESNISVNHNGVRGSELTWTTPPGFTPIITQMPLKAESFSSLSLIFRNDVHLQKDNQKFSLDGNIS